MSRISISVNSFDKDKPGATQNYSVSFNGDFSKVREGVDKIYEESKIKKVKR